MKEKQYAVIGLGTFGYNVAVELEKKGIQVLAVDNDPEIVDKNKRISYPGINSRRY
jgi:trk system potassium uptake protein TrkA